MARKRDTAKEIVAKLRQVDVLMEQGRQVADAVRAIGLNDDQVKRLKELETEHPAPASCRI